MFCLVKKSQDSSETWHCSVFSVRLPILLRQCPLSDLYFNCLHENLPKFSVLSLQNIVVFIHSRVKTLANKMRDYMFIQHPVLQSIFNSDLSGTCYICNSNWSRTVSMLETELKLRFSTRQRCCSYQLYKEGMGR